VDLYIDRLYALIGNVDNISNKVTTMSYARPLICLPARTHARTHARTPARIHARVIILLNKF